MICCAVRYWNCVLVHLYIGRTQELIKVAFFLVQNVRHRIRNSDCVKPSLDAARLRQVVLHFPIVRALLLFCLFNDAFQLHGLYFGESVWWFWMIVEDVDRRNCRYLFYGRPTVWRDWRRLKISLNRGIDGLRAEIRIRDHLNVKQCCHRQHLTNLSKSGTWHTKWSAIWIQRK
jgi:hypothetical protein